MGAGQIPHPFSYIEIDSSVTVEVLYLAMLPGNHVFEFTVDNPGGAPSKVYASNSADRRGQLVGNDLVRIRAPMALVREISHGEAEDNLDTAYFTVVRGPNSDQVTACQVMASSDPSAGGMIVSCRPQFDLALD
jgi:hypothetical protein